MRMSWPSQPLILTKVFPIAIIAVIETKIDCPDSIAQMFDAMETGQSEYRTSKRSATVFAQASHAAICRRAAKAILRQAILRQAVLRQAIFFAVRRHTRNGSVLLCAKKLRQ